jgi:hypothetical protein
MVKDTTRPQDCPSFDNCDAPMCPLGASVGWLEAAAWFPGEAICNCKGTKPRWVEVQRRIEKVTGGDRKRGFFTVRMLEALTAVTPAIQGIDVDTKDEAADVEAWCAKRKRQQFTPETIERMRAHRLRTIVHATDKLSHCAPTPVEKTSFGCGLEETTPSIGISGQDGGVPAKSQPAGEKNTSSGEGGEL